MKRCPMGCEVSFLGKNIILNLGCSLIAKDSTLETIELAFFLIAGRKTGVSSQVPK